MHTLPEKKHGDFKAMAQGKMDYIVDAICIESEEHGAMMVVCATEEAVYITKDQAKAFFNLVDA